MSDDVLAFLHGAAIAGWLVGGVHSLLWVLFSRWHREWHDPIFRDFQPRIAVACFAFGGLSGLIALARGQS
jgi:hypothetical protein